MRTARTFLVLATTLSAACTSVDVEVAAPPGPPAAATAAVGALVRVVDAPRVDAPITPTASPPPPSSRVRRAGPVFALPSACSAPVGELVRDAPLGGTHQGARSLLGGTFGGAFGFFEVRGDVPPPSSVPPVDPLVLELRGPAKRRVDEPLDLELRFVNRGPDPLVVMRALDGSLERWQSPTWDLYLRDPRGVIHRYGYRGGRCGNVNPIGADDYVELAPGQTRADVVGGWSAHLATGTIAVPGEHRVWVVYSFCGFGPRSGTLGPDLLRADVHATVVASNALTIRVLPGRRAPVPPPED